MGGFNYGEGVASKAWLPSISWLDYSLPYIEYSNIIKDESSFNNSEMIMISSAWARSNWYIYSDLALANGNYFVRPYIGSDGDTNNFGENSGGDMVYCFCRHYFLERLFIKVASTKFTASTSKHSCGKRFSFYICVNAWLKKSSTDVTMQKTKRNEKGSIDNINDVDGILEWLYNE